MLTKAVYGWMEAEGIRQTRIAKELQMSRPTVWQTINNASLPNKRVVEWLLAHGCPESFLVTK